MTDDFNDDIPDLTSNTPAAAKPVASRAPLAQGQPPANYIPLEKRFEEPCPKCKGRGRFISYAGRDCGPCFSCKGAGKNVYKTSRADREKASEQRYARKAATEAENVVTFAKDFPAVWAWINAQTTFEFAASMRNAIAKYGYLTEKQMAACERLVAKDASRKAEAEARKANAPVVASEGIDRLKAAFDKAAAYTAAKATGLTMRSPKITIGGLTISPAKATSKNPGALYVTCKGADRDYQSGMFEKIYLGKIADGKFYAARECTTEQQVAVLKFIADPAQAAKVYGQETGVCCVCNATLKSEWRLRGIGPICAEKFGW